MSTSKSPACQSTRDDQATLNASVVTVTPRRRMLMLVNIILCCIASSLLSTALSTALPPIISEFGIEVSTGQWITSIYALVMAIMIPMTAFLAKRVPTKPLYVGVIGVFLFGTALCMCAPNIQTLLLGRALQAIGGGAITTVGQIVLFAIFPIEQRGTIMGWYGLALSAAPIVAPTVGGVLADTTGWRSIFALVGVVMLLSLIFAAVVFANVLPTSRIRLDMPSFLLTAIAFGGVTYGIGTLTGGIDRIGCAALVVGIIGAVLFVRRQLRLDTPFLNVRVFQSYRFRVGVIAACLLYLVMIGPMTTIPLAVQDGMGFAATVSGLMLLPGSICSIIINPVAGKLFDRTGARRIAIVGSALTLASMIALAFVQSTTSLAVFAGVNAVRTIGISLVLMPLLTWSISGLDESMTADGTSLFNALAQMMGAVSTAVFAGIMGSRGMAGFNMSSAFGALCTLALFIVAIVFIKNRRKTAIAAPTKKDAAAIDNGEISNTTIADDDISNADIDVFETAEQLEVAS
ncbi:DHA2 family efflux MFS transporter permease subunit [uncultured Bifidobacterium sp.]|uniref:DHA2 family efflux MFS transporter permease subunit n=1 Tax=uncultured Bifidobacterium sp. TaxID=165187 RepID=UPI00259A291E|nr:DHA2 family efflux MFS transporter permease subunit [uncultured Bifidobacterium sp.]